MKLYVASSWRNRFQEDVVKRLRDEGHEVYDFKNPQGAGPGTGFAWQAIDPNWRTWTPKQYLLALTHAKAQAGFESDERAMIRADACVLVLPAGRSAHVEFGWMLGRGQLGYVLLSEEGFDPDLMYLLTPHSRLCTDLGELVQKLKDDQERRDADDLRDEYSLATLRPVTTLRSSSARPNMTPIRRDIPVAYGSPATPPIMPHVIPSPAADVVNEIAIEGGTCNLTAPPPAFVVLAKLKGAVGGPEVGDEYHVRGGGYRELCRGTAAECRSSLILGGYEPAGAEVAARVRHTLHADAADEVWVNPAEVKRLDEWFEAIRKFLP